MTGRPRVTYHLWQSIKDRAGRETLREADYHGYHPMPQIAIEVENGIEVIYFPQAERRWWRRDRRNTIVAAEKRVNGARAEFAYVDQVGGLRIICDIQPRLALLGANGLK